MNPPIALDGTTVAVPVDGDGWVLQETNYIGRTRRRSVTVYPDTAAALKDLVTNNVRWGRWEEYRSPAAPQRSQT